jgi:hypothetical protein
MSSPSPFRILRLVLIAFGLVFIFGIPALNRLWPSGWAWTPEQPAYLHMIWSIYATLGVFLLLAARNPVEHLSLIWFTVWSSVAHGGVMAVHHRSRSAGAPLGRRGGPLPDRRRARGAHATPPLTGWRRLTGLSANTTWTLGPGSNTLLAAAGARPS